MKSNNTNSEQTASSNDTKATISGVKKMQQSAVGVVEQQKHGKPTIIIELYQSETGEVIQQSAV